MISVEGKIKRLKIEIGNSLSGGDTYSVKFWIDNCKVSYTTIFKPKLIEGDEVYLILKTDRIDSNKIYKDVIIVVQKTELQSYIKRQKLLFSLFSFTAIFLLVLAYHLWSGEYFSISPSLIMCSCILIYMAHKRRGLCVFLKEKNALTNSCT